MLPTSNKRASSTAAIFAFATVLYLIGHGTADAQSQQQSPLCERPSSGQSIKFSGLYPAIEEPMALSNFAAGQELDVDTKATTAEEARKNIGSLQTPVARTRHFL